MTAPVVDLAGQAGRRARLAALLGRLLVEEPGPDAATAAAAAAVPDLAALGRADPGLAAEFERLLLRDVPAFESVFCGEDGQRGGPVVAEVVDWYRRHDFDEHERWRVASADHLGVELRFLAHLAAGEAAAWAADRPEAAARAVEAEREFLAAHLGGWGEVALGALRRRAGGGPYAALAAAAAELLAGECERLRPAPDHPDLPVLEPFPPPARPGPARLARWLLAPARCGAFLDAVELGRAAHSIGVPWRPSDTRGHFRHVVEAAVDSGELGALLTAVRPAVERARDAHAAAEAGSDGNRRAWRRWRLQAQATLDLLDGLVAAGTLEPAPAGATVVVEVDGALLPDQAAAVADAVGRLRAAGLAVDVVGDSPDGSGS